MGKMRPLICRTRLRLSGNVCIQQATLIASISPVPREHVSKTHSGRYDSRERNRIRAHLIVTLDRLRTSTSTDDQKMLDSGCPFSWDESSGAWASYRWGSTGCHTQPEMHT